MSKPTVDIGEWFNETIEILKANYVLLIGVNGLAIVMATFTCGILAGPAMAGVALIMLRILDKDPKQPEYGDVFKGFDYLLPSLILYLIMGVASALVGTVVPVLGGLVAFALLQTLCIFSIFFIVEKKMDFWPAIVTSYNAVKDNFVPMFLYVLLINVIGSLGALACGIGVVLTMPIFTIGLAVAYRTYYVQGGGDVIEVEPLDEEIAASPAT